MWGFFVTIKSMESSFSDQLKIYRDYIEDATSDNDTSSHPNLSQAHHLALERNQDPLSPDTDRDIEEAEWQIFDLQQQKQHLMAKLHSQLQRLDNPQESYQLGHTNGYPTRYRGDQLQASTDYGQTWQDLSLADLLTDLQWGLDYSLKSDKIPRHILKQYLIQKTKNQLQQLLNDQILYDTLSNHNIDHGKRHAYQALMEERQKIPTLGHIAEAFIKNILTKEAAATDLGFHIAEADLYDDVQNKIDFIITKSHHTRLAAIEEDITSSPESLGIQFTINPSPQTHEFKRHQISRAKQSLDPKHVQDLILVALKPDISDQLSHAYATWSRSKAPGGPDKLLPSSTKEAIFKALLHNMYSPQELNQAWQQAHGDSASEDLGSSSVG